MLKWRMISPKCAIFILFIVFSMTICSILGEFCIHRHFSYRTTFRGQCIVEWSEKFFNDFLRVLVWNIKYIVKNNIFLLNLFCWILHIGGEILIQNLRIFCVFLTYNLYRQVCEVLGPNFGFINLFSSF